MLLDDRLARLNLRQLPSGELNIRPISTEEDMLRVPSLADPFGPLVVGPFIPDLFPSGPDRHADPGKEPIAEAAPDARLQIPWKEATDGERDAFLSFLLSNDCELPDEVGRFRVRHAALSFYPALAFCELTAPGPGKQAHVLIDPDGEGAGSWFMLDGTNAPLMAANQRYLALDADNVRGYAAFFFAVVAGPHGHMPLIERLETVSELDGPQGDALERLRSIVPPVLATSDAGGFVVEAAMSFRGAVFAAILRIAKGGVVEVIRHDMLFHPGGNEGGPDGPA